MPNANDFARMYHAMQALAKEMAPDEGEPYSDLRKLVVYHLGAASIRTKTLSELMGDLEKAREASDVA